MHEVTSHSVYTYPEEIIVELRGQTADGEFTAISYQFEPTSPEAKQVQPRESVDDVHKDVIREALAESDYELASP